MSFYCTGNTQEVGNAVLKGWGIPDYRGEIGIYDGDDSGIVFTVGATAHGDYCGASYTAANYRVFCEVLDDIEKERGIELYYTATEAYGTRFVVLYPRAFSFPEVRELFEALEGYHSLDDEAAWEIEEESRAENWESYGRSEFRSALVAAVPDGYGCTREERPGDTLADLDSLNPLDYPGVGWGDGIALPWEHADWNGPDADEIIDRLTDDDIDDLYRRFCELDSVYPYEEGYGSTYFPEVEVRWSEVEGCL